MNSMNDEGLVTPGQPKGWGVGRNLITGDTNTTVSMQANFEPGDYTIQFDLIIDPAVLKRVGDAGLILSATALITWSVNGIIVTRVVNVGNGVSVSGNATGVSVVMSDTSFPTNGAPEGFGEAYRVSATVTRGTRPDVQQPPILISPNVDGTLGTVGSTAILLVSPTASNPAGVVLVPANAGAISALITVAGGTGPLLDQSFIVSQVIGDPFGSFTELAKYDPRSFSWCPLAPGTSALVLTNGNDFPLFVQVFWGIEG